MHPITYQVCLQISQQSEKGNFLVTDALVLQQFRTQAKYARKFSKTYNRVKQETVAQYTDAGKSFCKETYKHISKGFMFASQQNSIAT